MIYHNLFRDLISRLLEGTISQDAAAKEIANAIAIDVIYDEEYEALYRNCEWALRHANESDFYTTDREFKYYLECLSGNAIFSEEERNQRILL